MGVVPLLGNAVPPKLIFIAGPFSFIFLGTVAWKLKKGKIQQMKTKKKVASRRFKKKLRNQKSCT